MDIRSQLTHELQNQQTKDTKWKFDKINSLTIYFYQTGTMNCSNSIKIPLKSSAMLNIKIYRLILFLMVDFSLFTSL